MDDFGLFPARFNLQTYKGYCYKREFGNMWRMNTQLIYEAFEKSSLD